MSALSDAVEAFEQAWQALKAAILSQQPPAPGPVSPPPGPSPEPPPTPTPPPPAPTPARTREQVTTILLEEFAKQTSFIPGGASGSATPEEVADPDRAIQKWTDNLILNHNALMADEPDLRATMASMIAHDVNEYGWARTFPPVGSVPPASSPPPATNPPPAPPPTTGTVWTLEEVEEAIRQNVQPNQGLIMNVDNNKPGWTSRGSTVLGNTWTDEGAPSWAPKSGRGNNYFWPNFNFWGVLFSEVGNQVADGWIELMDQETQLLYRGADRWTRVGAKNGAMSWGELYKPDMITSTGIRIPTRAGTQPNSISLQMQQAGAPHWIDGTGTIRPDRLDQIEGVLCSALVRIDPRGNQNVKCLVHLGGDPKPDNSLLWYPGFAVCSVQKVTREFRRITVVNIEGAPTNYSGPNRQMTQARFRAVRPLR